MLDESGNISQPFLVSFETIELVATLCALSNFVRQFSTLNDYIDPSFVDIAEALIIRLQDILDENQIRGLDGSNTDVLTPRQHTVDPAGFAEA